MKKIFSKTNCVRGVILKKLSLTTCTTVIFESPSNFRDSLRDRDFQNLLNDNSRAGSGGKTWPVIFQVIRVSHETIAGVLVENGDTVRDIVHNEKSVHARRAFWLYHHTKLRPRSRNNKSSDRHR